MMQITATARFVRSHSNGQANRKGNRRTTIAVAAFLLVLLMRASMVLCEWQKCSTVNSEQTDGGQQLNVANA